MSQAALKRQPEQKPASTRVAIYCRKSTHGGLEQEFNSLDAQRSAVEAYVESQRGEGWTALPHRYDDGGFSGANTDRPAFQRLLADIKDGLIDVVGVYKLDRLSRSLVDFSRLMEFFDKRGITFISVTQSFNTQNSVGRMVINLLATFAQFERDQISERTRDKMRATRRRGQWTGGRPVSGYDLKDKRLVVNKSEAEQVREIFRLYLGLSSLIAIAEELNQRGWTTKSYKAKGRSVIRGKAFDKQAIRFVLGNVTYIGKVRYSGEIYPGQHDAIVDQQTWDAVQHRLKQRANGRRNGSNKWGALLSGLVRCGICGVGMTHQASSKRNGRRYTYYVCVTAQKRGASACPGSRVAASELENFVVDRIRRIGRDPDLVAKTIEAARRMEEERRPELVAKLRRLKQKERRLSGERDNLLDAISKGGGATGALTGRLGEVHQALASTSREAQEVRSELVELENHVVHEDDLRSALEAFDPIWEELFPKERARILQLLVETVSFRAEDDDVTIQFRHCGLRSLGDKSERRSR